MKVPLSWLREYADLPAVTAQEVADKLTAAGLKLESISSHGHDVKNVVVGEVLEIEELTGFKKPIRHCKVEVGEAMPREIVCGATNFAVGDRVPVVLPGGVLPGGFEVGSRKTYGRLSEGMICSERELGLGDDHGGIMVLPAGTPIGADVVELLGLRDDVIELEITPDIGYALSIRGVAREAATAFEVPFRDPADVELPVADEQAWPASIGDPDACDRFVLREVTGFDPAAQSPLWMRVRLTRAGMRPVSLAVDITNYLMLERLAELQHQVVGDVDGQRDRAHPGPGQPHPHPQRVGRGRVEAGDLAQHEPVAGGRVVDRGGLRPARRRRAARRRRGR